MFERSISFPFDAIPRLNDQARCGNIKKRMIVYISKKIFGRARVVVVRKDTKFNRESASI